MFGIEDFSQKIVDFSNFEVSQLGDALVFGGAIMLIGMCTVFAVLCLLWLFLVLFKLAFHDLPAKRAAKKAAEAASAASDREAEITGADEAEIIAAITAAIEMAESDTSGLKFRVVSFKRV